MNLSAESRVVASFTFVVALLLGAWATLDRVVSTTEFPGLEVGRLLVTLVPFVVTGVALQASRASKLPWARTLGGAAVMLGVLCCLGALQYFVTNT